MENPRVVSKEEALQFQKEFGFDFFMECTTFTRDISNMIFTEAAKLLYHDYINYKGKKNEFKIKKQLKHKKMFNFLNY